MLFTSSTCLTPGPNNLMLMSSSLNFGIQRSLPHYLGICVGFTVLVLSVALGLGVLFTEYHSLQTVLKIAGSAYMLYLAWQISRSHGTVDTSNTSAKPFTFLQAAAFQWVNPKAWLMAIGVTSMFSISQQFFWNAVMVSLIYMLVYLPCGVVWMTLGTFIKRFMVNPHFQRWFNYIMGTLLALSVILIFID